MVLKLEILCEVWALEIWKSSVGHSDMSVHSNLRTSRLKTNSFAVEWGLWEWRVGFLILERICSHSMLYPWFSNFSMYYNPLQGLMKQIATQIAGHTPQISDSADLGLGHIVYIFTRSRVTLLLLMLTYHETPCII